MKKTIISLTASAKDALRLVPLGLAHLFGIGSARKDERRSGQVQKAGEPAPPAPALPVVPKPAPRPLPAPTPAPASASARETTVEGSRNARATPTSDDDDSHLHDAALWPAIQRERARCKAIVMSDLGLKNGQLAYQLAFKTRLTRSEALAVLRHAGTSNSGTFAHLAGAERQLRPAGFSYPRYQASH
jgi:hypothetical protein